MDTEQEGTSSEAQALADIFEWSKSRPKWQRDALRRLCTQGELNASDLDELTALCKAVGDGSVSLAEGHIPNPEAAASVVKLRSIRDVENINALKPGERLTFEGVGLTVVYGDNGSGKSGYGRILKRLCRARTPVTDEEILPNIYASNSGPQKAAIDFTENGQNRSAAWVTGRQGPALLSSVSVFDSRTANVHVDGVNDVAYTPFPMRILQLLAEACLEVRKRINAEISVLEQQTPEVIQKPNCHDGTLVHRSEQIVSSVVFDSHEYRDHAERSRAGRTAVLDPPWQYAAQAGAAGEDDCAQCRGSAEQ